ncbi:bifunctional phosphoribosylaminoimidazolecarboxamide formyltransferase/IMP cyclohydrolase [Proteiniclasticum sp. C24MP]|uniref:bifunctional phosphoribosylaminoimidazolecarboxamide formyltransferase/IMP cyclohydrolase n=1 Tax=Proteiniclasticum sp. C24MP TaxID=3374101 RepID=UPI003754005F
MFMRALISVYDKKGLKELADFFVKENIEMISTGGTYAYLKENGFDPIKVEEVTGAREILGGRVKTLHPLIHGGILYRRDLESDLLEVEAEGMEGIDIVCVNLYPFFEKLKDNLTVDEQVEFIDIGGPTMLRAAAKNYKYVYTLSDPQDYESFLSVYSNGTEEEKAAFRKKLAGQVFNLMGAYDSAVSNFLLEEEDKRYLSLSYRKVRDLRYGENPHQSASVYESLDTEGALKNIDILWGKELSYNNFKDLDIAWKVASSFEEPCCCALKHNTPCGVALGKDDYEAYSKAYEGDPVSIFGGIVALNCTVTRETALKMNEIFLEVVMAPYFTEEALDVLKKKKNLRIIRCTEAPSAKRAYVSLDGLMLSQDEDFGEFNELKVVTKKEPDQQEREEMEFAYTVVKYVKSNAIVVTKDKMTLGIGGGQVNRIDAAKFALEKAQGQGVVLASDAFFPFSDVVEEASRNNIKGIIQPGGSLRDQDSIDLCDEKGISMIFTSMRHFKH